MQNPQPTNGGFDAHIDKPDDMKDREACQKAFARNEVGMNEQVRLGASSKDCLYLKK
jgi:hypothetical protein